MLSLLGLKLLQKIRFLQIRPIKPTSKESNNRRLKPCLNLQNQMKMRKTQPQALPSNKMKTCVMGSHTLPLSNGFPDSIFKSLFIVKLKASKSLNNKFSTSLLIPSLKTPWKKSNKVASGRMIQRNPKTWPDNTALSPSFK